MFPQRFIEILHFQRLCNEISIFKLDFSKHFSDILSILMIFQ